MFFTFHDRGGREDGDQWGRFPAGDELWVDVWVWLQGCCKAVSLLLCAFACVHPYNIWVILRFTGYLLLLALINNFCSDFNQQQIILHFSSCCLTTNINCVRVLGKMQFWNFFFVLSNSLSFLSKVKLSCEQLKEEQSLWINKGNLTFSVGMFVPSSFFSHTGLSLIALYYHQPMSRSASGNQISEFAWLFYQPLTVWATTYIEEFEQVLFYIVQCWDWVQTNNTA